MHPDYQTRPARPQEIDQLAAIELAAAAQFRAVGIAGDFLDGTVPHESLVEAQADGRLWVALRAGRCVGFAIADRLDGDTAWLDEVDVHPDHGRRGVGRALVGEVVAWARHERLDALCLTTFRDVAWNAPFYENLGFREVDANRWCGEIRRIVEDEARQGLPMDRRVVMRLELATASSSA